MQLNFCLGTSRSCRVLLPPRLIDHSGYNLIVRGRDRVNLKGYGVTLFHRFECFWANVSLRMSIISKANRHHMSCGQAAILKPVTPPRPPALVRFIENDFPKNASMPQQGRFFKASSIGHPYQEVLNLASTSLLFGASIRLELSILREDLTQGPA